MEKGMCHYPVFNKFIASNSTKLFAHSKVTNDRMNTVREFDLFARILMVGPVLIPGARR
jgi:hypothetical protein